MVNAEVIKVLEANRDANPQKTKFAEACNVAIMAMRENEILKKRCFTLTDGKLCNFCNLICESSRVKR